MMVARGAINSKLSQEYSALYGVNKQKVNSLSSRQNPSEKTLFTGQNLQLALFSVYKIIQCIQVVRQLRENEETQVDSDYFSFLANIFSTGYEALSIGECFYQCYNPSDPDNIVKIAGTDLNLLKGICLVSRFSKNILDAYYRNPDRLTPEHIGYYVVDDILSCVGSDVVMLSLAMAADPDVREGISELCNSLSEGAKAVVAELAETNPWALAAIAAIAVVGTGFVGYQTYNHYVDKDLDTKIENARKLAHHGDYEDALSKLNLVLAKRPNDQLAKRNQDIIQCHKLITENRNLSAVIATTTSYINTDESDIDMLRLRAAAYIKGTENNLTSAEKDLNILIKLQPKDYRLRVQLANLLTRKGNPEVAISYCKTLITDLERQLSTAEASTNPASEKLEESRQMLLQIKKCYELNNLQQARLLVSHENYDSAIQIYAAFIEKNPDNLDIANEYCQVRCASALKTKQFQQVLELTENCSSENLELLRLRGRALIGKALSENYDLIVEAEQLYRTLLLKDSSDPDTQELMGLVLRCRGKEFSAVAYYQQAYTLLQQKILTEQAAEQTDHPGVAQLNRLEIQIKELESLMDSIFGNAKDYLQHFLSMFESDLNSKFELISSDVFCRCDFLVTTEVPNKETLNTLPTAANKIYVKVANQLFYVDKRRQECTTIDLANDILEQFDQIIANDQLAPGACKNLSTNEINAISALTGHVQRRYEDVLFQFQAGNQAVLKEQEKIILQSLKEGSAGLTTEHKSVLENKINNVFTQLLEATQKEVINLRQVNQSYREAVAKLEAGIKPQEITVIEKIQEFLASINARVRPEDLQELTNYTQEKMQQIIGNANQEAVQLKEKISLYEQRVLEIEHLFSTQKDQCIQKIVKRINKIIDKNVNLLWTEVYVEVIGTFAAEVLQFLFDCTHNDEFAAGSASYLTLSNWSESKYSYLVTDTLPAEDSSLSLSKKIPKSVPTQSFWCQSIKENNINFTSEVIVSKFDEVNTQQKFDEIQPSCIESIAANANFRC
jgi:hypothetical protein